MDRRTISLPVSEQFVSLQGEGPTTGTPSYFLRLKSCNLLCGGKGTDKDGKLHDGATWRCDTVEVWLKGKEKSFVEIVDGFGPGFISNIKKGTHHLILTGGETLLHEKALVEFINFVQGSDMAPAFHIEVETNGTINPLNDFSRKVTQWNVSPKLSNSGMPAGKRINAHALDFFINSDANFKFVVSELRDIEEALTEYVVPYLIPRSNVYFMPAADNEESLQIISQEVAELCISLGYKFTTRLHVAIWNKKTGV